MINPKFVNLLNAIQNAGEQGRLEWTETTDEDAFRVMLKGGVIRISKEYDEFKNSIDIVATLASRGGNILDTLSTADVDDETTLVLLRSIHETARRQVKRVDQLLDVLIKEVETHRPSSSSKRTDLSFDDI